MYITYKEIHIFALPLYYSFKNHFKQRSHARALNLNSVQT